MTKLNYLYIIQQEGGGTVKNLLLALALAAVVGIIIGKSGGIPTVQASSNCQQYHEKAIQAAEASSSHRGDLPKAAYARESLAWSTIAANCAKQ